MNATCCPLSGCDGDASGFIKSAFVKSRKEHQCCECLKTIAVGETYESVRVLWDGSFDVFKTCTTCSEIRNHFACDGYTFERLWGDLRDNFLPDMKAGGPCMEGLSPAAKAKLFEAALEAKGYRMVRQ